MPILSSRLAEDSRQIDGRRWVREQHTDQMGVIHEVVYMAEAKQTMDLVASAGRDRSHVLGRRHKLTETDK